MRTNTIVSQVGKTTWKKLETLKALITKNLQLSQPLSTSNIMQILRAILACMKRLSVIPYSPEKLLSEVSIALLL